MPGVTDMRKSMFSLAIQVNKLSNLDPFSGDYFVFVNKKHNILKIIFYHKDGMCMFQKNLGNRKFFTNTSYDYYIKLQYGYMIDLIVR